MVFREKLEENQGCKTKSQVDAEVAEHRARLIADAEQSKKAEFDAKAESKAGRTRYVMIMHQLLPCIAKAAAVLGTAICTICVS